MYLDAAAESDIRHVLWRDQDVLLFVRCIGRLDHHLHADTAIHSIHEHVKFVWVAKLVTDTERVKGKSSPRHRNGHPIHSHRERRRQIVEKDFSPPLSDRGSLSRVP